MDIKINSNKIESIINGETININENTTNIMDVFENITGSTIINKSIVEKSFNKVKEQFDEETASTIQKIAEIVNNSNKKEAGELFNAFNEELNKPEPKKSLLSSFWSSLTSMLPVLSSTASIAANVLKMIS